MIYQRALDERKRIDTEISSIKMQLSTYPDGNFYCTQNGNNYKWYQSDGKNSIYIPKSQRTLAEQLAAKKYLTLRLEELTQERRALDFYLRHHKEEPSKAEQLLTSSPEYRSLLSPYFKSNSEIISDWINEPYISNPPYPEFLRYPTSAGINVRSKSETIIVYILQNLKIPFRYECPLQLGTSIFYPDFTLLHPRSLQISYYEHFGQMDKPSYSHNAFSKLEDYAKFGIIPGINLLTTFETSEHPLNAAAVEKMLREYFL